MTPQEVVDLAESLVREHAHHSHRLTRARVELGNGRSQAGVWDQSAGVIRLSRVLLPRWEEAEIRDTILHEIAHAIAGVAAGHGPLWQSWCRRIGARPEARYDTSDGRWMPPSKYVGVCPGGHEHERDARPRGGSSCRRCRLDDGKPRGYYPEYVIVWHTRAAWDRREFDRLQLIELGVAANAAPPPAPVDRRPVVAESTQDSLF